MSYFIMESDEHLRKFLVKEIDTGWFFPVESEIEAETLVDKFNEVNGSGIDLYADFEDWNSLISNVYVGEKKLYNLKKFRDEETQKLLTTVDFKELYGKNNETIRKNHIKQELSSTFDEINMLEIEIANNKRKIELIKSLVTMKIELIKYGE